VRNARITGWGAAAIAAVLVATAASPAAASVLDGPATTAPAPTTSPAPEVAVEFEQSPASEESGEATEAPAAPVAETLEPLTRRAERAVEAAVAAAAVGDLAVTVFDDRYADGIFDTSKVARNGDTDRPRESARLRTVDGAWFEGNDDDKDGVIRFEGVPVGAAEVHVTYPNGPGSEAFFDATDAESAADIERLSSGSYLGTATAVLGVTIDEDGEARSIGLTALRAVADVDLPDGTPARGLGVELGSAGQWYSATEYDFASGYGTYEAFGPAGGYQIHLPDELGVRVTPPAGYRVADVTVEGGAVEVIARDGAYWMDSAESPNFFWNNTFLVTLEQLPTADLVVTSFEDRYADGLYDPSKTGRDGRSDTPRELGPRIRQADGTWLDATKNAAGDFVFADLPIGEKKVEFLDPNSYVSAAFFDATDANSADDIERLPLGGSIGQPTGVATVELDEDGEQLVVGMTALRAVAAVQYADATPATGVTVELGSAGEWFPATEYDFAGGQGTYEAFDSNGYVRHLPDELGVRVTAPAGYEIGEVTAADGGSIDVVRRDGAFWISTTDAASYFSNPTFTVTLPTAELRVTSFDDRYADGVFDTTKPAKDGRVDETNARVSRVVAAQGETFTPTTDASGIQVFENLPLGEAKVYFTYPNSAFDGIFFDATGAETAADIERVPNESTSALSSAVATVTLDEEGASREVGFTALRAAAEVEFADGTPASDVSVELGSDRTWYPATEYDFAGGEGTYEAFANSYYVRHLPDEIGVRVTAPAGYTVGEVTARQDNNPGSPEIAVTGDEGASYWIDTVDAFSYFSAPTFTVTLEEIPTAAVDVTYFLDVALDGVYESGTDTTVPGAEVYLLDAAQNWWATTSLDGTYAFSGIAPGAATIYVEIPETIDAPEGEELPGLELPRASLALWDATDLTSYRDVEEAETTTISFEGTMINADGTTTPVIVDDALVGEIEADLVVRGDASDADQIHVGGAAVLQTAAVVDTTSLAAVPGAGVEFLANRTTADGEELLDGSGAFIATEDDGEVAVFGAAEYGIRPTVPAGYRVVEVAALSLSGAVLEVTAQQSVPVTGGAAMFVAGTEYRVAPEQVGGPVGGIVWAVAVAPLTQAPPVVPGIDLPPTVGLPATGPAVLPATGSDVNVWALVFGASLLLAAGFGARVAVRRRTA